MNRKPFFYDVTLRDGNQALKKPWNTEEKEKVFNLLMNLNVQGVEVGFSGASDMDFEACSHLASIAPSHIVISGLARAVERDILKVAEAIKNTKATPRIHTFIAMSPFNMEHVLKKSPEEVKKIAVNAVKYAKEVIGERGEVQFSVEHFGDCRENLPFVIGALEEIIEAGATIINLPNTVERTRPMDFVNMVKTVYGALPKDITIAIHCHNDLGMATATTVESFFAGATQLECCLNGLGERAGNTNIYEVAVSLYNSGVGVPLNLSAVYETALIVSEMSKIHIHEKTPLIGEDALAHRSGIHQDGAAKTKGMKKGAYRPIHPSLIGREDDEHIGFTSQSGKTAVYEIITGSGYPITLEEAVLILPYFKEEAERKGELSLDNILDLYFEHLYNISGPFALISFDKKDEGKFNLKFTYKDKIFEQEGSGEGPLEGCLDALSKAGFKQNLLHYEQAALGEETRGVQSEALTMIEFETPDKKVITCRGKDPSTAKANVKAVFNGLNLIYS